MGFGDGALHPLLLGEALGELVADAEAVGEVGDDVVNRAAVIEGLNRLGGEDGIAHVAGRALLDDVLLLRGGAIREDVIGVAGGDGHLDIGNDDELGLRVVAKELRRAVDVRVLVGQRIAGVLPDHLDRHVQLVLAAHAVPILGHLRAVVDGVGPAEHGNRRLHGVFRIRVERVLHGQAVGGLAATRAATGHADIAAHGGQREDGAGLVLAVGVALRAPALVDGHGLGVADLAGELGDLLRGHTRDAGGPLRGLGDAVLLALEVGAVGAVFWSALGQVLLVEAGAVFVQEFLIVQVLLDHYIGEPSHEGGVRTRTEGDPVVAKRNRSLRKPGVDNDGLDVVLLFRLLGDEGLAAARHAGFQRVVPEEDLELGVLDIVEAIRRHPLAVVAGVGRRDLGRGIVRVVVEVAADEVHKAGKRGLGRGPGTRDRPAEGARAVVDVDGLVAVVLDELLHLIGDLIEGLVPGDLHPLAVATLRARLALQRGFQAVRVVDAVADRAAAHAGADLLGADLVVAGVIGEDAGDRAIFHDEADGAAGTAVHGAG